MPLVVGILGLGVFLTYEAWFATYPLVCPFVLSWKVLLMMALAGSIRPHLEQNQSQRVSISCILYKYISQCVSYTDTARPF